MALPFSIRALFSELMGEDDAEAPAPPESLPETAKAIVQDGIARMLDYQGPGYAQLYVARVSRFIGKRGVDDALLAEIARLLAARMEYEDPIRIAQLKLMQTGAIRGRKGFRREVEIRKFRADELVGALPSTIAETALDCLEWAGWTKVNVSIRFSTKTIFGVYRLRLESWLRRWRLASVRYVKERALVERWLHMIDRCLLKQPDAVDAIVQTATLIRGYGDAYRRGLTNWNLIIDRLAKPVFDGVLLLPDLAAVVMAAQAAALRDPGGESLRRLIATTLATATECQAAAPQFATIAS